MRLRVPLVWLPLLAACAAEVAPADVEPTSFRISQWVGAGASAQLGVDVFLPEGAGEGRPAHVRLAIDGSDFSLASGHVGDDLCEPAECTLRVRDASCVTFSADAVPLRWGGQLRVPTIELCGTSVAQTGTLRFALLPVVDATAPIGEIGVRARAPLDLASIEGVQVLVDGRSVGARYVGDAWVGRLEPIEPIAPFGELRIVVDAPLDVVGRALGVDAEPLGLTDVIADLSFETAPPSGAIVAVNGVLSWDAAGGLAVPNVGRGGRGEMLVLLGLGDLAGTTLDLATRPVLEEGSPLLGCALRGLALGPCVEVRGTVSIEIPSGDGPVALVMARHEGSRSALSIRSITTVR